LIFPALGQFHGDKESLNPKWASPTRPPCQETTQRVAGGRTSVSRSAGPGSTGNRSIGQPNRRDRRTRWPHPQRPPWPGTRTRVAGGRTSVSAPLGVHRRATVPMGSPNAWIETMLCPPRHPGTGPIWTRSLDGRPWGWRAGPTIVAHRPGDVPSSIGGDAGPCRLASERRLTIVEQVFKLVLRKTLARVGFWRHAGSHLGVRQTGSSSPRPVVG